MAPNKAANGHTNGHSNGLYQPSHPAENRWTNTIRPYSQADVEKLRGSLPIAYTLATVGADKLWDLINSEPFVPALGALSGNQAMQMVRAGLKAVYCSGWQVAGDANANGQVYPDQSLYAANSVPQMVKRINQALQRADQIEHAEGGAKRDWYAPIVADAEAGFGGQLNVYELMKSMIEAGAAGVHFEDQLASEKKCGHLGGKVLLPTSQFIRSLVAARLAADVLDVPTVLIARTDAHSAQLLTSDVDPQDAAFIHGERTPEGFYRYNGGIKSLNEADSPLCIEIEKFARILKAAIARGLAYAPHADLLWVETSSPDFEEAKEFANAIHAKYPGKLLAYNCSPSFNWKKHLSDKQIASFQADLGKLGYAFQFVTLAGFHTLNHSMFQLAKGYAENGMSAYSTLQQAELAAEKDGYTATKHQREVGTGYFDTVATIISAGTSSTLAWKESTEASQF